MLPDPRDQLAEDATPVCPHCIEPLGAFDHFCPHCGGPVSSHASIDPLGQVFAAGWAYRNATTPARPTASVERGERPRGITVLGMWLIFGPQCLVLVLAFFFSAAALLNSQSDGTGPLFGISTDVSANSGVGVLASLALLVLYIAILWQVTRRWLAAERRARK